VAIPLLEVGEVLEVGDLVEVVEANGEVVEITISL